MILSSSTCDQLIEWEQGCWHYSALRIPTGGCLCGRGATTEGSRENLRIGLENLAEGPIWMLSREVMKVDLKYRTQAIWIGRLGGDDAEYACTVDTQGKIAWGRADTRIGAILALKRELNTPG